MKITFSEKEQKFKFKMEEQDFYDAIQIEEMVKGSFQCRKCGESFISKGWDILKGYINTAREKIIESGKDGIKSKVKRQNSDLKFAKLSGLDELRNLPDIVILQANIQKEALEKQEEMLNAARDDD